METAKLEITIERLPGTALPWAAPSFPEEAVTLSSRFTYLLSDAHEKLPGAEKMLRDFMVELPAAQREAFEKENAECLLEVHKILFLIYELYFANPLAPALAHEHSPWLLQVRRLLEESWYKHDLQLIQPELPAKAGLSADQLCKWFEQQARKQSDMDRKVVEFLECQADREQFAEFILTDGYLNYRFYDALALAQPHFCESVKTEISHHMWDECGCGAGKRAHTQLFSRALMRLGRTLPEKPIWKDWRPYAGYNLYFLFGQNRRHYFKALGSLAMPELFDPERDRAVVNGLERLGYDAKDDFEYYYSHIEGDEDHGPSWLEQVIRPIAELQPEAALELAIGGALRMHYMRLYNKYLAAHFNLK